MHYPHAAYPGYTYKVPGSNVLEKVLLCKVICGNARDYGTEHAPDLCIPPPPHHSTTGITQGARNYHIYTNGMSSLPPFSSHPHVTLALNTCSMHAPSPGVDLVFSLFLVISGRSGLPFLLGDSEETMMVMVAPSVTRRPFVCVCLRRGGFDHDDHNRF